MKHITRRLVHNKNGISKDVQQQIKIIKAKGVNVVVVGAGLAGLSATYHLIQNGFENVKLLEATDRHGGRINTKHFGDVFCELGAKWIPSDTSKHSIYQLAQKASDFELKSPQKLNNVYLNDLGGKVDEKLAERVEMLFVGLCGQLNVKDKYLSGNMFDVDSVNAYFKAESSKLIENNFPKEDQNVARSILNLQLQEFSSLHGCTLDNVSIQHLMNSPSQSEAKMYIPCGLEVILKQLTSKIKEEKIFLGKPVGIIKWFGKTNRFVRCMDGTIFEADHIICTLPLGVLKNFSKIMFEPTLPKEKELAIENIGFGSPIKIYFEFAEPVDQWIFENFRPLRNSEDLDRKWTNHVIEVSKITPSDRVIEISIGGGDYEEIEKLPDSELVDEVTKMLRKYLKSSHIPRPTSILRSKWSSSACFLGGRPYFSTKSTDKDVSYLSTPLGEVPRLLFAGDATILNGFGCIDGARWSGIREAERILKLYK